MRTFPAGPHWKKEGGVSSLFWLKGFAVFPLIFVKVFTQGFYGACTFLVAIAAFAVFDFAGDKIFNRSLRLKEGIFFYEAMLFLLVIPQVPLGFLVIGAFLSVFLCRKVFGGAGFSLCHPALLAAAFLDLILPHQTFLKSGFENTPLTLTLTSLALILVVAGRFKMLTKEAIVFLTVFFVVAGLALPQLNGETTVLFIAGTIFILADRQYLPLIPGKGLGLVVLGAGLAAALTALSGPLRALIYSGLFLNFASIWLEYHEAGRKLQAGKLR